MPPRATKSADITVSEDVELDDFEANPVDAGLLLTTNPSDTAAPKLLDFKGFVGASRPLAVQAGLGVAGFVGANWFRENVSLKVVNALWKTATPKQGLLIDTIIQLFVAWQLSRRFKGLGKAAAFGILLNQGLAVGKAMMSAQSSRFDVVVFTPTPGTVPAPAPAPGENGSAPLSGIMPSRRMSGIMPARRAA